LMSARSFSLMGIGYGFLCEVKVAGG
jgi:hypothetical protein